MTRRATLRSMTSLISCGRTEITIYVVSLSDDAVVLRKSHGCGTTSGASPRTPRAQPVPASSRTSPSGRLPCLHAALVALAVRCATCITGDRRKSWRSKTTRRACGSAIGHWPHGRSQASDTCTRARPTTRATCKAGSQGMGRIQRLAETHPRSVGAPADRSGRRELELERLPVRVQPKVRFDAAVPLMPPPRPRSFRAGAASSSRG
jgi:hypothetical protein